MSDHGRALDYLEAAYASHSQLLNLLKMDRMFDPLRSEPRFIALAKKRFTEVFNTADLKAAKALLDELSKRGG